MRSPSRRRFLASALALGAGSLASRVARALAAEPKGTEYFFFVHAAGGWDVTLWSDPRNERKGLVAPASTDDTDTAPIRLWTDAPLDDGAHTFQLVRASTGAVFGPGIGRLVELADRITVINGLAMNTVSHPDGTAFSVSARHLNGGRVIAPSIDTLLAHHLGASQLFPLVSVRFPSAFVGDRLDPRVVPLRVEQIGTVARTLSRSQLFETDADRAAIDATLAAETDDLAAREHDARTARGVRAGLASLDRMIASKTADVFSADALQKAHPELDFRAKVQGAAATSAAFAIEAAKRDLARCVSFAAGGFDTHGQNYRGHALALQELFDLLAAVVRTLDATPHPNVAGAKLSEHTHILVVSDFCRTPQLNLAKGRDHYPNNSALVISPRFRGGLVLGKTDAEQLLPAPTRAFADGVRAIAPPDLLATFLSAFGPNPRLWMRDGEIVPELLRA